MRLDWSKCVCLNCSNNDCELKRKIDSMQRRLITITKKDEGRIVFYVSKCKNLQRW
jgi:hypothetical protein